MAGGGQGGVVPWPPPRRGGPALGTLKGPGAGCAERGAGPTVPAWLWISWRDALAVSAGGGKKSTIKKYGGEGGEKGERKKREKGVRGK